MSRVNVSAGSALSSSHDQVRCGSTAPWIVKLHWSSGVCGVGPAESTGKSSTRYWPGGTRSACAVSRRLPLKPRLTIGTRLTSSARRYERGAAKSRRRLLERLSRLRARRRPLRGERHPSPLHDLTLADDERGRGLL